MWCAVALIAAIAAAARVFTLDRAVPNFVLALVILGGSGACATIAWRLMRRGADGARAFAGWVLAYHSLMGPIAMLELAYYVSSRNDMLTVRLYPHIVHFLNSFE